MNPVLILTRNCLELTKKCIESVYKQDIGTHVTIYDNDSTDGTIEWLNGVASCSWFGWHSEHKNQGVSKGWNWGLSNIFESGSDYVLVLNNDVILPPYFYRILLSCDVPFVTGVTCEDMEAVMRPLPVGVPTTLTDGPDFSAFLIRRSAWELVGPFDENMVNYYSDNAWHVEAHRKGIRLVNCHCKFYHERSSTLRLASHEDQDAIRRQSVLDSQVFLKKYGCQTWTPEYTKLFEVK